MDFDKYQKLEKTIKRQSFSNSYKSINTWAYIFSIFGNCASIFFAYFLLFSILEDSMPNIENTLAISIGTVLFLSMFEMLKRYVFNKFSLEHIRSKFKFLKMEVIALTIFSCIMVAGSFYLSLNGAQKFTDQIEHVAEENKSSFVVFKDSIQTMYDVKIDAYEKKNNALKESIETLTSENLKLNSEAEETIYNSIKRAKFRLIKQNNERIDKNLEKIDKNDLKIEALEKERDGVLTMKQQELDVESESMLEKGSKNSIKFVILSSFIEIIILAGIYFNSLYSFKSFVEYEETIKADPNFNKWISYDKLLELIYNNGTIITRVGDLVAPNSKLIDLARINNFLRMDKNVISDGFKVLNHLGIITSKGSKRIVNVDYEIAKEVLKDYFKII